MKGISKSVQAGSSSSASPVAVSLNQLITKHTLITRTLHLKEVHLKEVHLKEVHLKKVHLKEVRLKEEVNLKVYYKAPISWWDMSMTM